MSDPPRSTDRKLQDIQKRAFHYFECEANPANGLIREKTAPNDKCSPDWPSSIAAVGFALASYPVAVTRGFLSREAAVQRTLLDRLISQRGLSGSHHIPITRPTDGKAASPNIHRHPWLAENAQSTS